MLAKTCSHSIGVDETVPLTTRRASFSTTSIRSVCALSSHTGAPYSATENTNDSAVVRSTLASAPYVVPASLRRRFTLGFVLAAVRVLFSLNVSVLSNVMPKYFGLKSWCSSMPSKSTRSFLFARKLHRWKADTIVFPGFG